MNMKQMEYTFNRTIEVLYKDKYKNFDFVIMSYGTHPCCYIVIPENHKYYKMNYDNIDILCHGGLTYGEFGLQRVIPETHWVIGWDYAHGGDYMGYMQLEYLKNFNHDNDKKWTTEELFEDVKDVIEQLGD